jgi:hypothetical protein
MPTTFSKASIESFALACCAACPTNSSVDDGFVRLSLLVGKVLATVILLAVLHKLIIPDVLC